MKPRAVLYARVSTADKGQDWSAQIEELRLVAARRGWEIVGEYSDETSGLKAKRPGLGEAMRRARAGNVDILASVAVDRIARSLINLLHLVDELEELGVKLACTREGDTDTTTPQGRAFLQARAIFAELERRLTAQRVREGLAVRRARGVKLGRRRTIDYSRTDRARELRAAGKSWSQIADELGGTPGAWSARLLRAAAAA